MDLDGVVDDELDAGEADAVGRQRPPAQRRGGIGQDQHDLGARSRDLVHVGFGDLDVGDALVDEPLVALGAGDGDLLSVLQRIGGISRADDGRQAEFPADDGRVGGPAAVIGDDRGRLAHDRHPVRVGHGRDQDRILRKILSGYLLGEHPHFAGRRRGADGVAAHEPPAGAAYLMGGQRCLPLAGFHGLRARLHDHEFARFAVLGPLDVHGPFVMLLDEHGPVGQAADLFVVQHEGVALLVGRAPGAGGLAAVAAAVDHLLFLAAEMLLDDRAAAVPVEQRLEDQVFVRVHRAADHGLAEPPGRVDEHDPGESGLGVDGEHDAGTGLVGTHHDLYADRQRHVEVVETVLLPVGDGPVGKQGGIAAAAGLQQLIASPDIEVGLLLAGETRLRQVFGGGAAAHGHRRLVPSAAPRQRVVGLRDGFRHGLRELAVADHLTHRAARMVQRDFAGSEFFELVPDPLAQLVVLQEFAIGGGGGREAVGHPDAAVGQPAEHLAERGILAADRIRVRRIDVGEIPDEIAAHQAQACAAVGGRALRIRNRNQCFTTGDYRHQGISPPCGPAHTVIDANGNGTRIIADEKLLQW